MHQIGYSFDTGAVTHQGRVRDHNEDSFLARPAAGLWLVADGMGGHMAGDFASRTIAESAQWTGIPSSALDLKTRFIDRLVIAHEDIRQQSTKLNGATIGATVVALLVYEQHFACIWSGDSRIYMMRGDVFQQMTTDHTEAMELLREGAITAEEAQHWPRKNVITRAIGVSDMPMTDENYGVLQVGDVFLLCSDGLTGHVTDEEIAEILQECEAQEACDRLLDLTLSRGAKDNITALVVRCLSADPEDHAEAVTNPGYGPPIAMHDWKAED
ncbi:PP2C family serine/threonine-protein phosphatase [Pseudorhodobacter sp.]|uniref:PP2C family protein-serine/threonine phosphatase n=1 Tax=Pseudorhodobacter sp. TaxID=1934400 RepID=UPI002647763D|nr:protein phosphatase 2C domain-containing protein [Pseudorhodobacter sp.]MDN5787819.1 protein phosphatase 2C domain-containing protein [Pseudorhodobacter sp.]